MRTEKKTAELIVFVAVVLLFMFSGTMLAQKHNPDIITHEKIIELISGSGVLVENNGKTFVLTELKQFIAPGVYEEKIELESWMLDINDRQINKTNTAMDNKFESIDERLALEVWMMQAFKLEDKILEEDLELEDWMLGDTSWFPPN